MAVKSVVIASGETDSTPVNISGYRYVAFEWPSTMTGATVTFKGAHSPDAAYVIINNEAGTAVQVTATDGQINAMNAERAELAAFGWIRLVSAGAEAAERTILIYLDR